MKSLLIAVAALVPGLATAAIDCFIIYDVKNNVTYQSVRSPIDLSKTISQEMSEKYPGQYLVWSRGDFGCHDAATDTQVALVPGSGRASVLDSSPLFASTNEITGGGVNHFSNNWYPPPSGRGSGNIAGTDVAVHSYTRSNGTVVSGHTRSAPGRGH